MKFNYYGVEVQSVIGFLHILKKRTQFASINGYSSGLDFIGCGVTQSFILVTLLFRIHKNHLPYAVEHLKIHHFTDDTNLLNFNHSIKKMKKHVNHDLKNLNN